jgi:prepilin-type N-terminal cleavage/methylation domain-containing protein
VTLLYAFKLWKKGLTFVEVMIVILIIAILITISSIQYNNITNNSRIQSAENDLSGWMSDINHYIEDYGPFRVDIKDGIDTEEEYLSFLCGITNEIIPDDEKDFSGFDDISNSPLNIFQSYCTNAFVIADPVNDVEFEKEENRHYIILTTRYQKDPWGQRYKIICDTVSGKIVVVSAGKDTIFNINSYKIGNYGDDVILVVNPKE